MASGPRDPQQIPEDASGADLAAYVGEDIGRQLVGRVAIFVALLCVLGGFTTDADQPVRTAGIAAGGVGAFALLVAALAGWRRSRQWLLILLVIAGCGALFATMLVQHRAAS